MKPANKFELVREIISKEIASSNDEDKMRRSLLDVGCRGCELKSYVNDLVDYSGADLFQNHEGSVDLVLDVQEGIPMKDGTYDFVVALDLVEHLDDFQAGLEELLRVSRKALIIMLPNIAHVLFRKNFLISGRVGAKYDLKYGMGKDRHRWLTILPQMDEYMKNFASDKKMDINIIWFNDSAKKRAFAKLGRFLGLSPSWWVWSSMYVLRMR